MKNIFKMIRIQSNLAMRNKQIVLCYYIIPTLFFLVFGFVLVNMNKNAADTLPLSMTSFSLTMGAVLGLSTSVNEMLKQDLFKAYKVMNVRIYRLLLAEQISSGIHLFIESIIIIILSTAVFNSRLALTDGMNMLGLFLYLIFVIVISTVFGMIINNRNILLVVSQVFFFSTILFGGIMFPISYLPDICQKVSHIMPAYKVISINSLHYAGGISFLIFTSAVTVCIYIISYHFKMNRKIG